MCAACNTHRDLNVRDTEGRTFTVSCPKNDACRVVGGSPGSPPLASLRRTGRVLAVCDGADAPAYDCRPLRCEEADDCPREQGKGGDCLRSVCVDPDRPYTQDDIVMLCLAGTGTGHDLAVQRERYARALESGEPPRVPAGCPSP